MIQNLLSFFIFACEMCRALDRFRESRRSESTVICCISPSHCTCTVWIWFLRSVFGEAMEMGRDSSCCGCDGCDSLFFWQLCASAPCRCCRKLCNGYQNSNGALAGGADGADVSRHADVVPDQEDKVQIQVEPRWPSKHIHRASGNQCKSSSAECCASIREQLCQHTSSYQLWGVSFQHVYSSSCSFNLFFHETHKRNVIQISELLFSIQSK